MTQAEAAETLYIRKSTLDAIECGRWDTLPHPVYVKGYIKSYASYLHVCEIIEQDLRVGSETTIEEKVQSNGGSSLLEASERRKAEKSVLRRLAFVSSSAIGLVLALAIYPAAQMVSPMNLKDLFVLCHSAVIDPRRVIFP